MLPKGCPLDWYGETILPDAHTDNFCNQLSKYTQIFTWNYLNVQTQALLTTTYPAGTHR